MAPAGVPGGRGFSPGYGYGYGYGSFPLYWGGYGGDVVAPAPTTNNYFLAPPPPIVVEPPPPPAHPEVREYRSEPAPAAAAPPAEDQLFVIALKDGSRISGAAIWIQGRELNVMGPDGDLHKVLLAAVDRQTTRDLNRARNLNLRLPAP